MREKAKNNTKGNNMLERTQCIGCKHHDTHVIDGVDFHTGKHGFIRATWIGRTRADAAELSDAIQKTLSPEAVAMIAGLLQTADHAGDEPCPAWNDAPETGVARDEVAWFRDFLIDNLGGADAFNRLQDEIGL